jgi:hypothetical protein
MRKFVIALTTITVSIIVAIIVESMAASSVVYAQNTTLQGADHNNTTNTTIPIKKLNASIIINAINSKISSVYDDIVKKSTIDYEHTR